MDFTIAYSVDFIESTYILYIWVLGMCSCLIYGKLGKILKNF